MSRRYILAPSRTDSSSGFFVTSQIGPTICDFTASDSYQERTSQVREMTTMEMLWLAKHGGEVTTWIDGAPVCTTTGKKRAVQQSLITAGDPVNDANQSPKEALAAALAASAALADQDGARINRRDERRGARALDQRRVHHAGQQDLFAVMQEAIA